LQILLLAQHVSGTTTPIIRSSRVLYSGCCLWYFVLWFSSCWFTSKHPANRTHNPQLRTRPATLVKKFPIFYKTQRFTATLTRTRLKFKDKSFIASLNLWTPSCAEFLRLFFSHTVPFRQRSFRGLIKFTSFQTHNLYRSSAWLKPREISPCKQLSNRHAHRKYDELAVLSRAAAETVE